MVRIKFSFVLSKCGSSSGERQKRQAHYSLASSDEVRAREYILCTHTSSRCGACLSTGTSVHVCTTLDLHYGSLDGLTFCKKSGYSSN
jgi:hypothetical protein